MDLRQHLSRPHAAALPLVAALGVVAAPIAKGYHICLLGMLLSAGVLLLAVRVFRRQYTGLPGIRPALLFAILGMVSLAQTLPLPSLLEQFSPAAQAHWREAEALGAPNGQHSVSLLPAASTATGCALLVASCMVLLAGHCSGAGPQRALLVAALILSGAVHALGGLLVRFGGLALFSHTDMRHAAAVRWSYANKNHFALLLEMVLPVALCLFFASLSERHGARRLLFSRRHEVPVKSLALGTALVIMLLALIFSLSRAGTVLGLGSMLLVVLAALWTRAGRSRLLYLLPLASGAVFLVLSRGVEAVWARMDAALQGTDTSFSLRLAIWEDALRLLPSYWRCGLGAGAFRYVSTALERGFQPDAIAFHAHNDWLEVILEYGLFLGGAAILATLALFAGAVARCRNLPRGNARWLTRGLLLALASAGLHACVGYGLRVPGNLLFLAALTGMAAGLLGRAPSAQKQPHALSHRAFVGLPLLLLAIGTLALCGRQLPVALANRAASVDIPHRTEAREAALAQRIRDAGYYLDRGTPAPTLRLKRGAWRHALADVVAERLLLPALDPASGGPGTLDRLTTPAAVTALRSAGPDLRVACAETGALRVRAVEDLLLACGSMPTNARAWSLLAQATQAAAPFTSLPVSSEKIFAHARALAPNLGTVSLAHANALARQLNASGTTYANAPADLRQELVRRYQTALRQSPHNAEAAYRFLWVRAGRAPLLHAITPDLVICQEALYRFLFRYGDRAAALRALVQAQRLNRERAGRSQSDLWHSYRSPAIPIAELERNYARREIILRGLLGDWHQRAQCLEAYTRLAQAERKTQIATAVALVENGHYRRAQRRLASLARRAPHTPEAPLALAELHSDLGDADRALRTLRRLLFFESPLPPPILDTALQVLADLGPSGPGQTTQRGVEADLLKAGLLARGRRWEEACQAYRPRLQATGKQAPPRLDQAATHRSWFGRALEATGRPAEALLAHGHALLSCPTHWAASQACARLSRQVDVLALFASRPALPEGLFWAIDDGRAWADTFWPDHPVRVVFGDQLELLGLDASPRRLRSGRPVTLTFYWRCRGELRRDYQLALRFRQAGHLRFTAGLQLQPPGKSALGWQVGEVAICRRVITPLRQVLARGGARLEPGPVDMQVIVHAQGIKAHRLQPLVPCWLPAFTIVPRGQP